MVLVVRGIRTSYYRVVHDTAPSAYSLSTVSSPPQKDLDPGGQAGPRSAVHSTGSGGERRPEPIKSDYFQEKTGVGSHLFPWTLLLEMHVGRNGNTAQCRCVVVA